MSSRWHRPESDDVRLIGVLNCTPDSFSDGGNYIDVDAAVRHGLSMWQAGAAIVDIGGESTRPGAVPVSQQEELARVIPLVRALSYAGCAVSLDTMKAEVMRQGIAAGAIMINDVSALRFDAQSMGVVSDASVDVCLMHMQGEPTSMQANPHYADVVDNVCAFFQQRITACMQAGIAESAILLDPGIGFGKQLEDNLALIRSLGVIRQRFGMPVLLGVSRKSFLGLLTGSQVMDREMETAVAGAMGIAFGADMLRVHDVALQKRAAHVASAISQSCLRSRASLA